MSRLVASLPVEPTYRDVINNAFVFVHQSLHKLNETLRKKGSTTKTIIITPSHFLDAIQHFVMTEMCCMEPFIEFVFV